MQVIRHNKKRHCFYVQCLINLFVGGDGFEPPKSKDSRFTVCPIWPLW